MRVKATEVKPYHYSIRCTIEGSGDRVVENEVVVTRWREDGLKVVLMFETHNFLTLDPDEEVEVEPAWPSNHHREKYGDWSIGPRPVPKDTVESLRAEVERLRGLAKVLTEGMHENEAQRNEARAEVERMGAYRRALERVEDALGIEHTLDLYAPMRAAQSLRAKNARLLVVLRELLENPEHTDPYRQAEHCAAVQRACEALGEVET